MSGGSTGGAPAPTIAFKQVTDTVTMRRIEIPPGGVVAPYRVDTGYVVYPVNSTPTTLRKTTYHNGAVQKVEDLTFAPDTPFYVKEFPPGVTVSVMNIGTETAVYGKKPVIAPDYTKPWP